MTDHAYARRHYTAGALYLLSLSVVLGAAASVVLLCTGMDADEVNEAAVRACVQQTSESLEACRFLHAPSTGPILWPAAPYAAAWFIVVLGCLPLRYAALRHAKLEPAGEWEQRVYARVRGF